MEPELFDVIMIMDAARRLLNTSSAGGGFGSTDNNNNSSISNNTAVITADSQALRETLKTYGSTFLVFLVIFCVLQKIFPRIFAVRSWSEPIKCDLAEIPYGVFSWMWKVFWVDDEDIQDQCGMDTLCFFRMLRFGRNLAFMGCFNAIWLLPLYRIAEGDPIEAHRFTSKPLESISIINVPPGSKRLVGTVVAAYILFFYAMWMILKEFEWYITYRHRFLEKRVARNYAVYVSGIPEEFRTSIKLAEYFRRCCPREDDILEAHCALNIPHLEGKVAKRKTVQQQLEHAQALEELRASAGTTCSARSRNAFRGADMVPTLREDLRKLDMEIRIATNNLRRENSQAGWMLHHGFGMDDNNSYGSFGTAVNVVSPNTTVGDQVVAADGEELFVDVASPNDSEHRVTFVDACDDIGDQAPDSSVTFYSEDQSQEELSRPILAPPESALSEVTPPKSKQRSNRIGSRGVGDNVVATDKQDILVSPDTPPNDLEQPVFVDAFDDIGNVNQAPDNLNSGASGYSDDLLQQPREEQSRPILASLESALSEVTPQKLKQRIQDASESGVDRFKKISSHGVEQVKWAGGNIAEIGTTIVGDAVGTAITIVVGPEEGTPREAGFVVFTNLYAVHSALQMVHHRTPHVMKASEAPPPHEIFWRNVGLPVKARRVGRYVAFAATAVLCLFWSIPVAFISSLTQVSSLERLLPFLKHWLEAWPGLAQLLAQLAPLLLYVLNSVILPNILKEMSKWEGHISSSSLQASVFIKLGAFMIIQTFFITAISGSIAQTLSSIIDNPKSIISLLANSLPGQSSYFIQIVLVGTFSAVGFTMLRVSPLFQAWARTKVGPKLTENERNRTWMWQHPLAEPPEFFHGQYTPPFITAYMVTFVYATITPITPFFMLACFLLIESVYRLEFFRNFNVKADSGGKLWKAFINIMLVCMIVAQVTLLGFLALKKAVAAVPLMVPLVIITILFFMFINDKHMQVATMLPTSVCLELDRLNAERGASDFRFVEGKYLQPALQLEDAEGNSTVNPVATAIQDV